MVDINDPVAMRPLWDAAIDQTLREFGWDKLADQKRREALIDWAVRNVCDGLRGIAANGGVDEVLHWTSEFGRPVWFYPNRVRAEFRRLSGST